MTANDSGHINNLTNDQVNILKETWRNLINEILDGKDLTKENWFQSTYGKELFNLIGFENADTVVLRWIRARKWNVNDALRQLFETLKWRIDSNINQLVLKGESQLSHEEISTGKCSFIGYDKSGRPIIYVSSKNHIKDQFPLKSTEDFTIFIVETGRKFLKYPVETATILFDLSEFSMKNMDYQHVKFLFHLLENYYPECLGLVLIVNAPWIFNSCWFIIKPWIDPVVQSKIRFVKSTDDLTDFIDLNNLPKSLNGNLSVPKFVPTTEKELFMFSMFKQDSNWKRKLIEKHEKDALKYLEMTDQWINSNDLNPLSEQRKRSQEHLKESYVKLLPYRTTTTHYHRIGLLNESIFNETFQRIQEEQKSDEQEF